jgi:hypothetical protein
MKLKAKINNSRRLYPLLYQPVKDLQIKMHQSLALGLTMFQSPIKNRIHLTLMATSILKPQGFHLSILMRN